MCTHRGESRQIGIESVRFYTTIDEQFYNAPDILLRDMEEWLYKASSSHDAAVREIALDAFQKLVLASGSLCCLFKLGSSLLSEKVLSQRSNDKNSLQRSWNQADLMSTTSKIRAHQFLVELSSLLIQHMLKQEEDCAILDPNVVQEMTRRSRYTANCKDDISTTTWSDLLTQV